jgi:hypothetical protein
MTPQEQRILAFLRSHGTAEKAVLVATVDDDGDGMVAVALNFPSKKHSVYAAAVGMALLSEYRATLAPHCRCGLCAAVDVAISSIPAAADQRFDKEALH